MMKQAVNDFCEEYYRIVQWFSENERVMHHFLSFTSKNENFSVPAKKRKA